MPSTLLNLIEGPAGSILKREILPRWLPERRWFRSKARAIRTVAFAATFPLEPGGLLCVVRLELNDGETEDYLLPLALATPAEAEALPEAARIASMAALESMADGGVEDKRILIDACWHREFREALFAILFKNDSVTSETNDRIDVLRGRPASSAGPHGVFGTVPGTPSPVSRISRVLSAEQSNTSLIYGTGQDAIFVKLYRKLEQGIHPEPEMLRFLREQTAYRHVPEFRSALEWIRPDGAPTTVALAQEFLPNGINAWEHVLEGLRVANENSTRNLPNDFANDLPEHLLTLSERMGRRVGELHAALGSPPAVALADFAPEPFTSRDDALLREATMARLEEVLSRITAQLNVGSNVGSNDGSNALPPETAAAARAVLDRADALRNLLKPAAGSESAGQKIRTHGDLHLGQMLVEEDDLRILDFEGEPGRTLQEARLKRSPLRDVAGMLRSFHYATHAAEREQARGATRGAAEPRTEAPSARQSARLNKAFLAGYFAATDSTGLLPARFADRRRLLGLFLLEKALYELQYEWNNRPDWASIPLHGLLTIASGNPDDFRDG